MTKLEACALLAVGRELLLVMKMMMACVAPRPEYYTVMLCVTGLSDTNGGYGFINPRPKPLAGVAGYTSHQQRNTPSDALTQAQLS